MLRSPRLPVQPEEEAGAEEMVVLAEHDPPMEVEVVVEVEEDAITTTVTTTTTATTTIPTVDEVVVAVGAMAAVAIRILTTIITACPCIITIIITCVEVEDGEDHEVVVDVVVEVHPYPYHPVVVVPSNMILLVVEIRNAADRVLVVRALLLRLVWTTFETMRVKATTVKGVFTIAAEADVAVVAADDSLAAEDEVTGVVAGAA
jgi:hypothetical protein